MADDIFIPTDSEADQSSSDQDTFMEDASTEDEIVIAEYDVTASPNDFNVSTLINLMDKGVVKIPPYQRNYTWDKRRASKLIESLLLGLPIPQLFLYEESRNRFAILDGQQRLMSLYFYIKGRFPKKEARAEIRESYDLNGVFSDAYLAEDRLFTDFSLDLPGQDDTKKSRYHGLKYQTLGDYGATLDLRTMRCVIIKQNEPSDDNSSIFEIFDRLNTGGVNLKPQEIRANIYYSEFYQYLYDLNKDPVWRDVFGNRVRDNNLRDVELILRSFAMLVDGQNYKPTMTRFLNTFSSKMKHNREGVDYKFIGELFSSFCCQIAILEAEQLFRAGRNEAFSILLFESIFAAVAGTAYAEHDVEKMIPISTDILYNLRTAIAPHIQYSTASSENVATRLRVAREALTRSD